MLGGRRAKTSKAINGEKRKQKTKKMASAANGIAKNICAWRTKRKPRNGSVKIGGGNSSNGEKARQRGRYERRGSGSGENREHLAAGVKSAKNGGGAE